MITPDDSVILWYTAPEGRITVTQSPLGENEYRMVMSVGDDSSLEQVTVNGYTAAWMNGEELIWEGAGMSYDVEGDDLILEEAVKIAESLR